MVEDTIHDLNSIIPLPAQKIYLCMKSPIVHDIANVLISNEMKNEIMWYYDKHHNIPKSPLQQIDWEAHRLAMNAPSAISYRKYFTISEIRCPLINNGNESSQTYARYVIKALRQFYTCYHALTLILRRHILALLSDCFKL